MDFRLLGHVTVLVNNIDVTPTAPKVRQVLAFLLIRRNQIVQVSEFIDELWKNNPPDSAMTTLQTYIYKLRKEILAPNDLGHLYTKPNGYLLDIADERLDVCRFEQLSSEGRLALQKGDSLRAANSLTEALSLWRGQALLGVTTGETLSSYVVRLEEIRLRALEMRIEADMQLGRHHELLSELKVLTCTYPLHERFYGDLMTALNRSGRRYEALETYGRLRRVLIDELGLEPSATIQRLHQSLLIDDSIGPLEAAAPPQASLPAARPPVIPAQLPPDISDFTGRARPLSQARLALAASEEASTTARMVSICGMPGAGKTTLALHAAHIERAQYPDGQLFSDLHGASGTPADPADALADFLRAMGVSEHQVPSSLDERAKLFRTLTSGRRILVVLDDACSAAQAAPLLPATPECAVVITSRWGLQGLPGVRPIELGAMSLEESVELLAQITGANRVAAEQEQAEMIADLCGGLPLALRCVGAQLAAMPAWRLSRMVTMIESDERRLNHLRFAGIDVRADYDDSYRLLDPSDRSAFRLLSLLPQRDFSATTVSELTGGALDYVEDQLFRLVDCNLLGLKAPGGAADTRYELHQLVRLYARERLDRELIQPDLVST